MFTTSRILMLVQMILKPSPMLFLIILMMIEINARVMLFLKINKIERSMEGYSEIENNSNIGRLLIMQIDDF